MQEDKGKGKQLLIPKNSRMKWGSGGLKAGNALTQSLLLPMHQRWLLWTNILAFISPCFPPVQTPTSVLLYYCWVESTATACLYRVFVMSCYASYFPAV
jgi:hypothetical protein